MMNNGNGIDLLKKIRATSNLKNTHVICMSGYSEFSREEILKNNALNFYDKPIELDEIISFVKNHFEQKR